MVADNIWLLSWLALCVIVGVVVGLAVVLKGLVI